MSKPVVENIYPLSSLQQAMLLHHLQAKIDQGLLQVTCEVKGNFDRDLLGTAWQKIVDRHEVLRSSLHHEKVERPVQVVRAQAVSEVEWVDGRGWSSDELRKWQLAQYEDGLDFLKPPISRIAIVRLESEKHLLCWLCHHILIDGWSTTIILSELFEGYDALNRGGQPSWGKLPTHGSYLAWKKDQDLSSIHSLWSEGFGRSKTLSWLQSEAVESAFVDYNRVLPSALGANIEELAQAWQVSLNVIYQLAWILFLAKQDKDQEVRYGLTVSGRSGDLAQLDEMVGLYMNVLPVVRKVEPAKSVKTVASELQMWLLRAVQFDHLTIAEIAETIDERDFIPETLFTFENLPWSPIELGEINVDTFKGGITSNFPLALVVIPGSQPLLVFRYNQSILTEQKIVTVADALQNCLEQFWQEASVSDILALLPTMELGSYSAAAMSERYQLDYAPPTNEVELKMTKLWESILRRQPLGMDQDFFALGGKSLDAIRLFVQIQQEFDRNLSPALLLQHGTIRSLANLVGSSGEGDKSWSSLVPLRANGSKPPLFCIHAGGAHVFFYQGLMQHLDDDQPVYGIQPSGLDGVSETESSIEEMAAAYFHAMRRLQPQGPYCILGYCFSVPVCIEIDKLIRKEQAGESLILIVDSGPWFDADEPVSMSEKLHKLVTIARNRNWSRLGDIIEDKSKKVRSRYLKNIESKHSADLLAMENQLREIYQAYQWQPFEGAINLLRSREFADRADKEFHLIEWKRLALAGLEVNVVEGHHKSLFDEPDVKNLAAAVQSSVDQVSR